MTEINLLNKGKYYTPYKGVYPYIVQIGTGGTGGYIVQHLAQMLGTSGIPHSYILADPDEIEIKNLQNQLFLEEEVGLKKADVLASRYSSAYNLNIASFSERYLESVQDIKKLFRTEYIYSFGHDNSLNFCPILIGAVDNSYTRQILHQVFQDSPKMIYIDAGNESTIVPQDWQTRPTNEWTEEEIQIYKNSGWSGQIVCGVKLNDVNIYQPPLGEVHPEILEDKDSIKPSELSCSELSASDPQRIIANKFAALGVVNFINQIIDDHSINQHITRFHAKKGYIRSYEYHPEEQ